MTALKFGRRNKYGAKRADGFASKLEAAVYGILLTRERLGEIKEIKRQQTVVLQDGPREHRITWKVDFSFVICSTGANAWAEAKGFETADYKIKLKLWRKNPPGRLEIYRGHYRAPKLVEVVEACPDTKREHDAAEV
jgi:hypothetical protein